MSSLVFQAECQTFLPRLPQSHWPLGYTDLQLLWGAWPSRMTPLALCVLQVSSSTCSCFSSAAERVLGSFEDLSGCVASDQIDGGWVLQGGIGSRITQPSQYSPAGVFYITMASPRQFWSQWQSRGDTEAPGDEAAGAGWGPCSELLHLWRLGEQLDGACHCSLAHDAQ